MFTESDREEFKEVFAHIQLATLEAFLNHKPLPSNIMHNGKKVGILVSFHKCDESDDAGATEAIDPPPVLDVW